MRSVALDLGAKKIAYCEVAEGQVVERRTVRALGDLSVLLGPNTRKARVAIEACREAWHVHDELTGWGHDVLLVDTTRVAKLGVGQHGRKTDRVDAEVLARAVESGHIPRAHVLSPARRALRMQISVRRALVETRSQYITSIRGLLRAEGAKLAACETEVFVARFGEADIKDDVRELCAPLIALLTALEPQLATVEKKVQQLAAREPVTELLMTAPGVGVAAWGILRLRTSDPLKTWAEALAERRGKRVAVIALARRLAGVLWALWRDGTVYDPAAIGKASARGTEKEAQSTYLRAQAIARAAAKVNVFARRRRDPRAAAEGNR
jgi:transposase